MSLLKLILLLTNNTIDVTSYESNNYNLGHYLRDNSREFYYLLSYKINKKLKIDFEYIFSEHGDEIEYTFNDNYTPGSVGLLENITWDNSTFKFSLIYEMLANLYLKFSYENIAINGYESIDHSSDFYLNKFTPEFYIANPHVLNLSLNISY